MSRGSNSREAAKGGAGGARNIISKFKFFVIREEDADYRDRD
jgi:hypothetical protein